jgi:predicted TIM-barrel fold metal-dependent hydrolase
MQHPVVIDICYAITHAVWEDYPLRQTNRMVKELYYRLGPSKLVWGSDYPNIERLCTYAQSLNHVKNHCPFISASDMALILGGTLERLLASTTMRVRR